MTTLHSDTHPDWYWTTTNASEAIPGVLTPLGWSLWGPCGEKALRGAFHAIGGLTRAEAAPPASDTDRVVNIFYGRIAINVDTFIRIGNAMPGTSGAAIAEQMLGFVPPELPASGSRRRYAVVAARFPAVFAGIPRRARRLYTETAPWWRTCVFDRIPTADLDEARSLFDASRQRFDHAVFVQTLTTAAGVQPVFEQLSRLTASAGIDAGRIMTGYGSHAETDMVHRLWNCSRNRGTIEAFLGDYGYHGPGEGEVSGRVWRENTEPLHRLVAGYAKAPDSSDPHLAQAANVSERQRLERQLLSSLPGTRRPGAKLLLRLARNYVPLRGLGKVAFLQSLDVCRAAARRIGEHLVADGVLADREDVFHLSCAELLGGLPADPAMVVADRRREREHYETLDIPVSWRGSPTPVEAQPSAAPGTPPPATISGIGASAGVVEGRARIVLDAAVAEMDLGDVLVAHTTDPSWASIMFLASALVVDIGGLLSHAAVVARELGIPCVMGTANGTTVVEDGDWCRVDGSTGSVEILKRDR